MSEIITKFILSFTVTMILAGVVFGGLAIIRRAVEMKLKLSGVVAAASWASVLVMAWLLFVGTVESSSQRTGIFIMLLLIAIGSGLIYTSDGQKRNHE